MGKVLEKAKQHPYFHWRKTADASVREGGAFALMAAVGETYFPAFALAAGLGVLASGWVVTFPLLLGAVLQLFIPRFLARTRSHRRWVVRFTILQGLAVLPLVYFSIVGNISMEIMFGCAVLYWTTGMLAGPVWNTWLSHIIPSRAYTGFFARRTRQMQIGSCFGFLTGGLLLHWLPKESWGTQIFAPLFLLAFFSRAYSIWILYSHPDYLYREPEPGIEPMTLGVGFREVREGTRLGRLIVYLLAMHFSVHIAGPFVNPYLLDHLQLDYLQYALLITACYLGKILAIPFIGQMIHRRGPSFTLGVGAVFIPIIPACFVLSPTFGALVVVQFLSGIVWASYDLSAILLLLNSIPKEKRAAYLSYHQFAVTLTLVSASLIGGMILKWGGVQAYMEVFLTSFVLRSGALILYFRYRGVPSAPPATVDTQKTA